MAALLLLIPVGYALLFGFGPIPAFGAAGLGYATALVMWLEFIAFVAPSLLKGATNHLKRDAGGDSRR